MGAFLRDAMGRDKKNESGRITLILLDAIGRARIEKATPAGELEAERVEKLLGLPVCDVFRDGPGVLVDAILAMQQSMTNAAS